MWPGAKSTVVDVRPGVRNVPLVPDALILRCSSSIDGLRSECDGFVIRKGQILLRFQSARGITVCNPPLAPAAARWSSNWRKLVTNFRILASAHCQRKAFYCAEVALVEASWVGTIEGRRTFLVK